MLNQEIIDKVSQFAETIPPEMELQKMYVYGNATKMFHDVDGKIDVAMVFAHIQDYFSTCQLLLSLSNSIDLRIEPHPIEESEFNSENPEAWEILQSGIEVKIIPAESGECIP